MCCNRIPNLVLLALVAFVLSDSSQGVTKPHVISFGKWMPVTWTAGTTADEKLVTLKIRPLVVDGRVRGYVLGSPHEVTERLFVVRLPDERQPPRRLSPAMALAAW